MQFCLSEALSRCFYQGERLGYGAQPFFHLPHVAIGLSQQTGLVGLRELPPSSTVCRQGLLEQWHALLWLPLYGEGPGPLLLAKAQPECKPLCIRERYQLLCKLLY